MQLQHEGVPRETNQAPPSDDERQVLFVRYAKEVADAEMPWLFPLLQSAGARVAAAVGLFCFHTEADPGVWHEIPELGNRLRLVPWVTEDDIRQ